MTIDDLNLYKNNLIQLFKLFTQEINYIFKKIA